MTPPLVKSPAEKEGTCRFSAPVTPRAFSCRCGRPVFFGNSLCLACGTPLGYDPARRELLALEPVEDSSEMQSRPATGLWRRADGGPGAERFWRCSNLATAALCNWLVAEQDTLPQLAPLCRCCRLTRTLPDLSVPEHALWWNRIEEAKRRLVSSLIGLNLPIQSKTEDAAQGWVFDLLRSAPGQPPVVTGHDDGVITLDVHEADNACREQRRTQLAEPYRTLLGHLRHESGHYYWQRLVEQGIWLEPFRALFGDDRQDYAVALERHYAQGAPADWGVRFVSAYASSHPWEDWAETWAHYLHMVDTLDTARSFGLDGERVELSYERFGVDLLADADLQEPAQEPAQPQRQQRRQEFLRLLNGWMELTGVLNELSRSMGVADFYPFVLSAAVVKKLYLVHRVIAAGAP